MKKYVFIRIGRMVFLTVMGILDNRLTLIFSQVDGENKYDNGRVKMIIRKAEEKDIPRNFRAIKTGITNSCRHKT